MHPPLSRPFRVPVVAVLCALIFLGYGLAPSPTMAVVCDASQSRGGIAAELSPAHCQVNQLRRFGWLPAQTIEFTLQDIEITSSLCDNTPQGGVRFCHRLTLLGENHRITLPELRTPLTATTVTERLRSFMAGHSTPQMTWSTPHPLGQWLSTAVVGLLLSLTAWGLWSVQWPPPRPHPLALDGDSLDGDSRYDNSGKQSQPKKG